MPVQPIPSSEAQLLEIFSSIQGEAGLIGYRQIFLRFAGCNLDCAYCDTDFSPCADCRVEDAPGSGQFRSLPNPVTLEIVAGILGEWVARSPGMHHSISLTGGEPLLQAEVLRDWAPVLQEILPLHLETNGTCPEELEVLLPYVEWISMDVKLASVTGTATPWGRHRAFLKQAARSNVWVKVVVGEQTSLAEMAELGRMVHRHAPRAAIYLQPVTRQGRVVAAPARLLQLQTAVSVEHARVRVVPQTHVLLNLL